MGPEPRREREKNRCRLSIPRKQRLLPRPFGRAPKRQPKPQLPQQIQARKLRKVLVSVIAVVRGQACGQQALSRSDGLEL